MLACDNIGSDSSNIVRILVNAGCNLNVQNINVETALILACKNINAHTEAVVKILVDAGGHRQSCTFPSTTLHSCDLDLQNNWTKHTALILACKNSSVEIVQLLLMGGCNLELRDYSGRTALMNTSNCDILSMLIAAGCDINVQDYSGRTALMGARDSDMLLILINAGCDIHVQDANGYTVLMMLIKNNFSIQIDIIKDLIIMSKNSLTYKSNEGKTAYDYYLFRNGMYSCSYDDDALDEYHLAVLKSEIFVTDTKSARKH